VPAVIDGHKDVRNYILLPTLENVLHMLEKVQMSDKVSQLIQTFNNSISHDERSQFVETPQNADDHILFLNDWHIQQISKISIFPVTTI
jgi:hypothetical protein